MNSRKKKLAAAAMLFASVFGAKKSEALNPRINTQLSGSKAATPAAAMSKGLNKATTKVTTNKSGLPAWAMWTLIGGGSAAGIAAMAGTIWYCLKDKNKNPQDPNETNKSPGGVRAKGISSKVKIKAKRDKQKGNILSMIEEDVEGENKNESEEGDGNEKKVKDLIQTNENAVEEQLQTEDFPIVYNTNEAEENEKKQKEAEEKAKQKLEQKENENAFYEAVAKYNVLSKFMNALRDPSHYVKFLVGIYKDGKLNNNVDNLDKKSMGLASQFNDFKKDIGVNGKKIKIELLKNEPNNIDYKITFDNDMYYNIVILGYKQVAIKALGLNGVLFEFQNDIA